eukprot:15759-Eustigmatos_ZCMA.PRE.1
MAQLQGTHNHLFTPRTTHSATMGPPCVRMVSGIRVWVDERYRAACMLVFCHARCLRVEYCRFLAA